MGVDVDLAVAGRDRFDQHRPGGGGRRPGTHSTPLDALVDTSTDRSPSEPCSSNTSATARFTAGASTRPGAHSTVSWSSAITIARLRSPARTYAAAIPSAVNGATGP